MSNRTSNDFLVFGQPLIGTEEIDEVVDSMRKAWLGTGPKVAQFESAFAAYKKVSHVAALNSCTAALHLSMLAAGLGPGDEVITTPLTFCATVNAIIHAGATPVLADIDSDTLNISPATIRERITSRTRAILPVHFAGRPCDMSAIMQLANEHGLKVVEDCAHAIETEYMGQPAGTFGDFGCFSFYATKNITTGEGGLVIAKREEDIARIKILGLHGMSKDAWRRFGDEGYKHYYVVDCGYKYNMMDIQAAIGIHQLRRVDAWWHRRAQIWKTYNRELAGLPLTPPPVPAANTRHGHHLYTVLVDKNLAGISRDEFLEHMTSCGIGVGVHYLSIPEHPYYQNAFGWRPQDCPNAMAIAQQIVSLPLSPKLSEDDVSRVIDATQQGLR